MPRLDTLNREWRWQTLALLGCISFGIAFILNTHPAGDGLWFWYATLLRGGHRLYADMHLPLQPLFVLLTMWTQILFGYSWLASKTLAVAQLVVYCIGITLIAQYVPWRGWQKAVLIAAAFSIMLNPNYFRFDDYHITGYCLEAFALCLLLRIELNTTVRTSFITAALLGISSGLSIANRLNDGGALFVACGLALLTLVQRKKLATTLIFCFLAFASVLCVIGLTGDSIHSWLLDSIIGAAAVKGGTRNALSGPIEYPRNMVDFISEEWRIRRRYLLYPYFVALSIALIARYGRTPNRRLSALTIVLGTAMLIGSFFLVKVQLLAGLPLQSFSALSVLFSYFLGVFILFRLFVSKAGVNRRREVLLLIPITQLLAGAVTSLGTSIQVAYHPAAELLLLLPICFPTSMERDWQKIAYVALAGFLAATSFHTKTVHPYEWHHYSDRALFLDRQWYRHPTHGLMYIERDQLDFMRAICAGMDEDGPTPELLSLPYPYPNYFCNVTPWHGYVQTWYDTSSKKTIDRLIEELKTHPPRWVVYQRGLDTMAKHEVVFTKGQPLPHRALDAAIMEKLRKGDWIAVRSEKFQDADWFLIRTTLFSRQEK